MNKLTLLILVLLYSCQFNSYYHTKNGEPTQNIFHKYKCTSNVNVQSDFNPPIRKIEFDYTKNIQNATIEVKVAMTTSLPEGELKADHELVLYNGDVIKIHLNDLVIKDYIDRYSYLSQQASPTLQPNYEQQIRYISQIFNLGKFTLSREEFNQIKTQKLKQFNFNTKYSKLQIQPNAKQIKELNNYFFVVL